MKSFSSISAEMANRIELWPIERLKPYERNARTHSAQQVQQVANSIAEFGFTNPILVDGQDGIIAGHARLLAARQLGRTQVPVIVLSHLSEAQKRAYILADNQLALNAGWDAEILRAELQALEAEGFDIDLVGFEAGELKDLLEDEPSFSDEDDAPVPEVLPVSRPGEVWILGSHRVLCGDVLDSNHLDLVLAGDSADMVFTDPPYGVAYESASKQAHRAIANDNLGDGFEAFLYQACVNMLNVTHGGMYICMSSSQLHLLHQAFCKAGGHWSTFIIWAKDLFTLGRSDYQRQYECILYGWKQGATRHWCGARNQGDLWHFDKPRHNDLHPTMKPIELIERAITNSSQPGDIVLDGMAGSGSTLIACEKTKRRGRMIEIDPIYIDVIIRRWQDYTGGVARRAADQRPFDEVSTELAA